MIQTSTSMLLAITMILRAMNGKAPPEQSRVREGTALERGRGCVEIGLSDGSLPLVALHGFELLQGREHPSDVTANDRLARRRVDAVSAVRAVTKRPVRSNGQPVVL